MMAVARIVVALGGTIATFAVARAFGMWNEFVDLAVVSAGIALFMGALGALGLVALRRTTIVVQSSLIAVVCVAGLGTGAVVAARRMFLSQHDLQALLVILTASATAAFVVALTLGHRVSRAGLEVARAARDIGKGNIPNIAPDTGEFARLADELKDTSRRLEQARTSERALDASRRELVAWVSHDLRTPLSGIRAIAEALEDGVLDDPDVMQEYYKTLRIESDRLAGLVDDLFELSRINAGALRLHLEKTSLEDLVSDALAATARLAHVKDVKLEGRVTGPLLSIELSTPEMARALRNILENAIRHTPTDGSVCVEAGIGDGEAVISIVDECGGIPKDDIDRVFDLAYRGESARTPGDQSGAGLGLAIAKGIVEAHNGQITVANEARGCRFTLRVPTLATSNPA